ncbi:MAG: outer membrane beta-barrel protein, partial [Victivallales bacterium]|nr:outer membrane beta-barrel protein [Victivallales bacterium]
SGIGTTTTSKLNVLHGYPSIIDRGAHAGEYAFYDTETYESTAAATGRFKWEMDLYVFDIGASVGFNFDNNFAIFGSAGPSITFADMESRGTSISNGVAKRSSKDELETEFGYYISGGASYWFNERMGLSLEIRYDNAFGSIGTKYVSQNLDTWGGQLKFLCRF